MLSFRINVSESNYVSFGWFLSKNSLTFAGVEPERIYENTEVLCLTGLSKNQKTISVFFEEAHPIIDASTYNTSLKNRLSDYAGKYPTECRLVDDDENGCLAFKIRKGRLSFKLNAPYSAERRKAASELAKKNTQNLQK